MRRPGRVHPLKVGLDHLHDYLSQVDIETGSPHAASAGVPNTSHPPAPMAVPRSVPAMPFRLSNVVEPRGPLSRPADAQSG